MRSTYAKARQRADLKHLVQLQAEVATSQELTADQSDALLRILGDYARALDVLDQYGHQRLNRRFKRIKRISQIRWAAPSWLNGVAGVGE